MRRLGHVCVVLVALAAPAAAQGTGDGAGLSLNAVSVENPTTPVSGVSGDGYKVGEGTSLYPVIGASTGFVSNVFYEEDNPHPAGVLRLVGQIGAGSLSTSRLSVNNPAGSDDGSATNLGSFQYLASLRLAYDFLLSGNDAVTDQGGLGVGATLRGLANPNGPFSFGFDDNFVRLIRAANFETDADTNRDINTLGLNLIYHPRGRTISGYLYYNNAIDIFENDDINFADRIQHRFGVHPTWRVFPKTAVYADVSLGVFRGLGASTAKVDSYPLIAQAGIGTLLTPMTTLALHAGYTNGFYASGPSYSGIMGGANFGYRYSQLGRVTLTYDLMYQDSVNANYYRDHVFRMAVQHAIIPFALTLQPEVHLRQYNGVTLVMGPPTRDDVIFALSAGAHYNFRDSIAVTLDYQFSWVSTDYRYMAGMVLDDPSFARHQMLLGVRWAL